MTPNQILKSTRRERGMTLEQMAETFGLTTQRLSQWERGDHIPIERIREWSSSARLPDWALHMAHQMWLASLDQQNTIISEQITQLSQALAETA